MERKHLAGTRRQGRGLHQPHPEFQNLPSSSVALTGQGSRGPSQSSRGWGHSAALDTRSRGHLGSHKHSSSRGCVDNRLELPSQWMLDMGCPETPQAETTDTTLGLVLPQPGPVPQLLPERPGHRAGSSTSRMALSHTLGRISPGKPQPPFCQGPRLSYPLPPPISKPQIESCYSCKHRNQQITWE